MNDIMNRVANNSMIAVEEIAEIANIQAKMILARNFPRDTTYCLNRILEECKSKDLAENAIYEFPRGNSVVRGASIRLVECVARNWGNIVSGIKEIASNGQKATIRAYCWDLETNYADEKVFDVPYIRNTKNGSYPLTDERDKYEAMANQAARRKRACMQAVIPQYVLDEALAACQATLEANTNKSEKIEDIREKVLQTFKEIITWITEDDIALFCNKPFANLNSKDIVKLRNLYTAIKDGYVKPEIAFKKEKEQQTIEKIISDESDTVKKPAEPETINFDDV